MPKIALIPYSKTPISIADVISNGLFYLEVSGREGDTGIRIKSYATASHYNIYIFKADIGGVTNLYFGCKVSNNSSISGELNVYVAEDYISGGTDALLTTGINESVILTGNDILYYRGMTPAEDRIKYYSLIDSAFESFQEAADNMEYVRDVTYPITYRPTNCSFPNAPTEAAVGDNVIVPVVFPDGYGLANESNIYVTNNRVAIPSTYSNGQLTFTMPDPTQ